MPQADTAESFLTSFADPDARVATLHLVLTDRDRREMSTERHAMLMEGVALIQSALSGDAVEA
jgi:hypothetical protein